MVGGSYLLVVQEWNFRVVLTLGFDRVCVKTEFSMI